jgi:spermidine synthase
LITEDAFKYIKSTKHTYDLIIIDVFNDDKMPNELFKNNFWNEIHNTLNNKGMCLLNSIYTSKKDIDRNKQLKDKLSSKFSNIESLKSNRINELIILEK